MLDSEDDVASGWQRPVDCYFLDIQHLPEAVIWPRCRVSITFDLQESNSDGVENR
ncbi:hypothetical protein ES702_03616 [subsurface metagenome]